MSDNFNFNQWIAENRVGPYAKDGSASKKSMINENVNTPNPPTDYGGKPSIPGLGPIVDMEESMDEAPIPPSKDNIYEPSQERQDFQRFMGLGGDRVISGIQSLIDDGYEFDDIYAYIDRYFGGEFDDEYQD
jgi:hypothetical protein